MEMLLLIEDVSKSELNEKPLRRCRALEKSGINLVYLNGISF